MPAILDDWLCAACGGFHTLGLDDHAWAWLNRDFSYNCPTADQAVVIRTASWDRVSSDWPDGAVMMLPADE
jgi:hypothetical protein